MDGTFTWASSIPLMSLLVAVYAAGVAVTKVNTLKQELRDLKTDLQKETEKVRESLVKDIKDAKDDALKHVAEIRMNLGEKIKDLKHDHERSSEDQGKRIGVLEADAKATGVRMELTGRHAVPQEVK